MVLQVGHGANNLILLKNIFVQNPNTRWRLVVEEAKAHPGL
jgi:hypothetical protein